VRARVSIEAGASLGWQRWVGDSGVVLGIDRFGASAPGAVNFERYGMTREALVAAVRTALERVRAPSTPSRA
jgi:transketolase